MHSFYLPNGNLDLVTIIGADAVKLLQGQVTCDVAAIPDPGFTRGALCSNKGRVLATFILVRQGSTFYLAMNKGLGEVVALVLKKYLPFYKCELRQLAADETCLGIRGDSGLAASGLLEGSPPTSGECRILEDGWICTLDQVQQQYLVHVRRTLPPPPAIATATINDWLACGVHSGQFPFGAEDLEKYTPQDLHLERHGYVSFTKGCYTGQEIVARMHYRGKLKKLLFLLEADSTSVVTGPTDILDAHGHLLGSAFRVLQASDSLLAFAHLPAEMENRTSEAVKNAAGLSFRLRVF